MESAFEKEKVGARDGLLNGDRKYLEAARVEFRQKMEILKPLLSTDQSRNLFSEIQRAAASYDELIDQALALDHSGRAREARNKIYGAEGQQIRGDFEKRVSALADSCERLTAEAKEKQEAGDRHAEWITASVTSLAFLVGIAMATFALRSLGSALANMLSVMQGIADNNLSLQDVAVTTQDDLGAAGLALNTMKNSLRGMIESIARTAEHVASASEEISSSATQQAQGAETQKDQSAQVATAMQEMSSTVIQVSENSNRAAEASRKAAETAKRGGQIVDDTLSKMRAIATAVSATAVKVSKLGNSSDEIGRIVGVIDDIADQTNLLALNAAIEAARAGEQGRGFAVVADEVRKLAERTSSATKEIARTIQNIQEETRVAVGAMESGTKQVEEGVARTAEAGNALKDIIAMAEQVGEMVMHIAAASTEQSSASDEVNRAMDQIARLASEAAAGAHESAKACQSLSGLALDLQKMVGNFQLTEKSQAAPSPADNGLDQWQPGDRPRASAAAAR
jgi:methyl-accepting chemotaxis protein